MKRLVSLAAASHAFGTARSIAVRITSQTAEQIEQSRPQMAPGWHLPLYLLDPDGGAFEIWPGLNVVRPVPAVLDAPAVEQPSPQLQPSAPTVTGADPLELPVSSYPTRHPMMPAHNLLWHPRDGWLGGAGGSTGSAGSAGEPPRP